MNHWRQVTNSTAVGSSRTTRSHSSRNWSPQFASLSFFLFFRLLFSKGGTNNAPSHTFYIHSHTHKQRGENSSSRRGKCVKKKFNILHNSTAPQFFFLAALSSIFTFFFHFFNHILSLVSLLTGITVYVARISSPSLDLTDALIHLT